MSDTTVDSVVGALLPAQREGWLANFWWTGLGAAVTWVLAAATAVYWPDEGDWVRTHEYAVLVASGAGLLVLSSLFSGRLGNFDERLRRAGPWLVALGILLTVWQILTAKLNWLPRPFFAPPQGILEVYIDDAAKLWECTYSSLGLLLSGYLFGATAGFLTGLSIGWSRRAAYWGMPVLRLIGPLPATAWLPIAFFAFPSSWSASVFLIAVATGVPVAILTLSGIAGVSTAYYDVARTLGANSRFLVLRVAIPAALPHVFVGLFMGMSASFAVVIVAEMIGVKAGIGWYLQWAMGWAAYANMYAGLLILALICSSLITILFRGRDHFLAWQKGLVRW